MKTHPDRKEDLYYSYLRPSSHSPNRAYVQPYLSYKWNANVV